jgi:CDP-paratose 2-epimerase
VRVLVTGGYGVIGSTIVKRLLDVGHSAVIIDAAEAPRNEWIADRLPRGEWVGLRARIERMSIGVLVAEFERVDAVIHAAASTGIPHSVLHPDDDWCSNVDATRVLLEALRKRPVPTVILSSVKPYAVPADIVARGGLREDDPLIPDEPYAASKAAQSMLAMAYAKSYGLPVVTFRCSNLYGPAPCHGARHGWMTHFCISAATGVPLRVEGDGSQTRDMLHGDDVYSACMLAIENADWLKGRVFNLGGGAANRISVIEAATMLAQMGGVEITRAPARPMDDLHVFVNGGAWLKETGWRPQIEVHDGLRRIFEWAKANADELRGLYAA